MIGYMQNSSVSISGISVQSVFVSGSGSLGLLVGFYDATGVLSIINSSFLASNVTGGG